MVEPYDYVFVWDEDIDVYTDGFDPEKYLRVVRDNGLHISQPALIAGKGAWPVTRKVPGEVGALTSSFIPPSSPLFRPYPNSNTLHTVYTVYTIHVV